MGYAGGGEITHTIAWRITRKLKQLSQEHSARRKVGVPNVITFSGNRAGMSDEEGAKNTNRGTQPAEKNRRRQRVTICHELLNSKVDHKDYMCDHTAWGLQVVQAVNSRASTALRHYHMQIMEGIWSRPSKRH